MFLYLYAPIIGDIAEKVKGFLHFIPFFANFYENDAKGSRLCRAFVHSYSARAAWERLSPYIVILSVSDSEE